MNRTLVALALAAAMTPVLAGDWKYDSDTDKATGTAIKYATLKSTNSMSLPMPYAGTNHGRLQVQEGGSDGLSALFTIDSGRMICGGGSNHRTCSVQMRFDDAPPVYLAVIGADDNQSAVLYFSSAKRFVDLATKAKSIRVAVPGYVAGTQNLEFDAPIPLQWESGPGAKAATTRNTRTPTPEPRPELSAKELFNACNAEAGNRLGDERKVFLRECLTRK